MQLEQTPYSLVKDLHAMLFYADLDLMVFGPLSQQALGIIMM